MQQSGREASSAVGCACASSRFVLQCSRYPVRAQQLKTVKARESLLFHNLGSSKMRSVLRSAAVGSGTPCSQFLLGIETVPNQGSPAWKNSCKLVGTRFLVVSTPDSASIEIYTTPLLIYDTCESTCRFSRCFAQVQPDFNRNSLTFDRNEFRWVLIRGCFYSYCSVQHGY